MTRCVQYLTVGEIAARLDVAHHRVEYAIRAHNISPVGRAGNARVFDDSALRRIKAALDSNASGVGRIGESSLAADPTPNSDHRSAPIDSGKAVAS